MHYYAHNNICNSNYKSLLETELVVLNYYSYILYFVILRIPFLHFTKMQVS